MNYFLGTIVALPICIALDYLWLGVLMRSFYVRELGALMRQHIHVPSAFVVYILMAVSITIFILPQFSRDPVSIKVFGFGAIFGLLVYGIYDFTNYATLTGWSLKFMIVDILWGGVVFGLTSYLTLLMVRSLGVSG